MRDPEYVAALFESLLEQTGGLYRSLQSVYTAGALDKKYTLFRKRLIDLMVEIELGNTPDWDQINGILPTLGG